MWTFFFLYNVYLHGTFVEIFLNHSVRLLDKNIIGPQNTWHEHEPYCVSYHQLASCSIYMEQSCDSCAACT